MRRESERLVALDPSPAREAGRREAGELDLGKVGVDELSRLELLKGLSLLASAWGSIDLAASYASRCDRERGVRAFDASCQRAVREEAGAAGSLLAPSGRDGL